MNKSVKRVVCLGLSAMTAFSVVGCNKDKEQTYSSETRPLVFSISALDGNFNPFYATSASDVTIAAQTQISMLTTNSDGDPVCGEDWPTVALDYTEKSSQDSIGATTEYEFVIKNGIKFSDGTPLTIKDVLFNLYVYLDPLYMGSATIYSTKIRGLEAYRTQDEEATEDSAANAEQGYYDTADARIAAIESYLSGDSDETSEIKKGIETMKTLYKESLETDWTSSASSYESYSEKYNFTETWQIFYWEQGLLDYQYGYEGTTRVKKTDSNGKYLTTLDPDTSDNNKAADQALIDEIDDLKADTNKIKDYMKEYDCDEAMAKEYAIRDFAINKIWEADLFNKTTQLNVLNYLRYTTLRDRFATEARAEYFDSLKKEEGGLLVERISGIETYKTSTFNGKNLGEEHDILKVVIDGVDPKAIWNMAFTVAPMHYYSSAELTAKADGKTNFGVDFGNIDFFDSVLQDSAKNKLPVGAGTYMATNQTGDDLDVSDNEGTEFYKNNWVYYKRNPYFETVGDGLCNAKIKYMRYKVVSSDQILNSLINEEVDVGEPNATQSNINTLGEEKNKAYLDYRNYYTNGYGYVGINPKYVPDIEVRRAIMKAMNVNMTAQYYTEALAEVIYRPMSITSWAYPKDANGKPVGVYEGLEFTTKKDEIIEMVDSAGWSRIGDGVFTNDDTGKPLKITFTIAGDTKEHPAYSMFVSAAQFLNECGFDVEVITDVSALRKLATGELEVWAAAWSSAIDPDLYQVYHKDSKATSVKNWGYDLILNDNTGEFNEEKEIIYKLSDLIDAARETTVRKDRTEYYAEALDLIMELAVELPTYQRNDLVVFNKKYLDTSTLNQNPSATSSVFDKLWEVDYN